MTKKKDISVVEEVISFAQKQFDVVVKHFKKKVDTIVQDVKKQIIFLLLCVIGLLFVFMAIAKLIGRFFPYLGEEGGFLIVGAVFLVVAWIYNAGRK